MVSFLFFRVFHSSAFSALSAVYSVLNTNNFLIQIQNLIYDELWNRCTRNKKSTIFLNSCKHLIFVKAKINKKSPVFDPRTDSQCFYLSCFFGIQSNGFWSISNSAYHNTYFYTSSNCS